MPTKVNITIEPKTLTSHELVRAMANTKIAIINNTLSTEDRGHRIRGLKAYQSTLKVEIEKRASTQPRRTL